MVIFSKISVMIFHFHHHFRPKLSSSHAVQGKACACIKNSLSLEVAPVWAAHTLSANRQVHEACTGTCSRWFSGTCYLQGSLMIQCATSRRALFSVGEGKKLPVESTRERRQNKNLQTMLLRQQECLHLAGEPDQAPTGSGGKIKSYGLKSALGTAISVHCHCSCFYPTAVSSSSGIGRPSERCPGVRCALFSLPRLSHVLTPCL